MKKLLGLLLMLTCFNGCFFAENDGPRHHGHEAVYVAGHNHCEGCGHVQVSGVWYDRD